MPADPLEREYVHQEIREQAAIAARIAAAPPPAWPAAGRVVLAGCGDSLCAALLCRALFPELALEAHEPMDATAAALELGAEDALVGISVSGRTPRVREALLRARQRGAATVAVTDDPESPLAREAAALWSIGASPPEALSSSSYETPEAAEYVGYHHDVAQTKTFLASVLTLARAAAAASPASSCPQHWPAAVTSATATETRDAIRPHAERLARGGQAFFLGAGVGLPLARFGAYKLLEFARPATWADLEEYCHTHAFATRPEDCALFLLTDPASTRRAAEIAPVLAEALGATPLCLRPEDLPLSPVLSPFDLPLPAGHDATTRALSLAIGIEWLTYLAGRVNAPDVNTFHAGHDTEHLVGTSLRTIRQSRIALP